MLLSNLNHFMIFPFSERQHPDSLASRHWNLWKCLWTPQGCGEGRFWYRGVGGTEILYIQHFPWWHPFCSPLDDTWSSASLRYVFLIPFTSRLHSHPFHHSYPLTVPRKTSLCDYSYSFSFQIALLFPLHQKNICLSFNTCPELQLIVESFLVSPLLHW